MLANDVGSVLAANVAQLPQHGTLNLASDGSFTYTPTNTYTGVDLFQYRVTDAGFTGEFADAVDSDGIFRGFREN